MQYSRLLRRLGSTLVRLHPRVLRGIVYWLPLVVLFAGAGLRLAVPDLVERMTLICFDLYQRAAPRPPGDVPIRIVDIDNKSIRAIGQWPWSRAVIAKMVNRLRDAGAAVVAFDIVFSEPDRTSPKMLAPLLEGDNFEEERRKEATQLLSELPDPDQLLAKAIRSVPTVTAFILTDGGGTGAPPAKAGFGFAAGSGNAPLQHVPDFSDAIATLPELSGAAAGSGFTNASVDVDGVVRRVPFVLRLGGKAMPSLAAETLRVAQGARAYIGRAAGANGDTSLGADIGLTAIRVGALTVPTDSAGRVWLHYGQPRADLYESAAKILTDGFDPASPEVRARFAGHIVLIGITAKGLVNDRATTSIARDLPGVEIQAQMIDEAAQGAFLNRPSWGIGADLLFTQLIGIVLILLLPRIGASASGVLGLVAGGAAFGASWFAFRDAGLLIDPVYPTVMLMLVFMVGSLINYVQTDLRQRQIRHTFSRYMSPRYVEQLARHPERLELGGELRVMTIMFCDIRGYTSISEGLDAHALTRLTNSFLAPMTEIITEHMGTIDKYIGDCIMAFWNAPLDDHDHAKNAVRAAQAMRRKLVELNRAWEAEAAATGARFHTINIGIGINSGECVVGNFGSSQRFEYSLRGDAVNLASRVEGLGKLYGVDLVIGEDTAALLDDPALIELDLVAVKGRSQAVRVYTLEPEPIAAEAFLDRHSALLTAYRRRDWAAALELLDGGALAAVRHLAPVYDLYRQRIEAYRLEMPPPDWNGVFAAQEK
jgi:adenylate cyclase